MTDIQIMHTSELDGDARRQLRALLEHVFAPAFSDEDFEHALGGMHVLLRDGSAGEFVGHASVVQRQLVTGERVVSCGYVEAVAVHPRVRGRGLGHVLMRDAGRIIMRAYACGALAASDEAAHLYRRHGWRAWTGTTATLTTAGVRPTPDDDDNVFVLDMREPHVLDPGTPLICDLRAGAPW